MTYEEKIDRFLNTVKNTLMERNDEYGSHEDFFIGMAHGMNAILLPKLKDKVTKEERKPDEGFMASIEEQIGVTGSARDGFRSDVTAYMFAKMRRGEKVCYKTYEPLKNAIESYLISSVRSMARIVTKSKTRNDDQKQQYSDMVQTLMKDYGYTPESAEEILVYASNNLWRDS